MKHILLIGGRDHTIHKIKKLGIDYTLFQTPELTTEEQIKSSKRLIVCDYEKTNEVVALAATLHQLGKFDAIVSFAEYGMYTAAICAKELNLPSNDIKPVEFTRDKINMRYLLSKHNLATVKFKVCESIHDVKEFFISLNKKSIVIKPFSGGGSCGVSFIQNENEIESAWKWSSEVGILPMLAEEYIEGKELSVESISLGGKHEIAMITEKVTTGFPNFIETGHQAPARLDAKIKLQIEELVIQFLDLIGQKTAPAHTEIKLTDSGPKIIESQTRIGGDQIWEMTEMITGVDLMSETICHLVGMPLPERRSTAEAASIRFFTHENEEISAVLNVEEAAKLPEVIRVNCSLKSGDKLGSLKSSDSRQGYVFCKGSTVENAIINAELTKNHVKVISIRL